MLVREYIFLVVELVFEYLDGHFGGRIVDAAREVGDVLIALDRAALAAEVLLEDRFDVRVAGNFVPGSAPFGSTRRDSARASRRVE